MAEFFINPWLLAGLGLVASPIIIHFLNKRRFRVHDWAAMDFLLQAATSNRRRVRFEDLIILLLRILAIACLVFAVARPFLPGAGTWREDERVVAIDDSFSLEALGPTGLIFDAAREAAAQQLQEAASRGVPATLVLGSRPQGAAAAPARPDPQPSPSGSATEAVGGKEAAAHRQMDALRQLAPSDAPLRAAALIEQLAALAKADRGPVFRSVVLVSDFRAVDWRGAASAAEASVDAALRSLRQDELAERFGFRLVDVGAAEIENVAAIDLRVASRHVLAGVPVRWEVEVKNFGARARARIEGAIEIAPAGAGAFRAVHQAPLPALENLAAGESAVLEAEHVFAKPGTYLVRAVLDRDALPRDDETYAVVDVREALEVAIVDGDPRPERFAGESGFLIAALSPRGETGTGIRCRRIAGAIDAAQIEGADVILVLNRAGLEAAEWDVLEARAKSGAGLGFFLGNRVDGERYRLEGERARLFPARLGKPREAGAHATLRIAEAAHPAFAVFAGIEGLSLEKLRFDRFCRLEPGAGASVVARYADPDETPAIVEGRFGEGRIAIFNTSADRDWSDWPTDPSYPIALAEWVRYLAPTHQGGRNLAVGEPIVWKATPGKVYELALPRGERLPAPAAEEGGEGLTRFAETLQAGFYEIIETTRKPGGLLAAAAGLDEAKSTWFAIRRPSEESDLAPFGGDGLRDLFSRNGVAFAIGRELGSADIHDRQSGELWRALALAAAAVLLLELLATWWFGARAYRTADVAGAAPGRSGP
jgi:hypothetical protein